MLKYELVSNAGEYATVAERITLFYDRYPKGRIVTRLVSRTAREITVQAFVYRSIDELRPSATGLAAERIGNGDINTVACLENTETSAIGRALANLGLTASRERPSREEIDKANRARAAAAVRRPRQGGTGPRRLTTSEPERRGRSLQHRADRVVDALEVLVQAARAGLAPGRVRRLRALINDETTTGATVERVERMLRAWTAARHARHLRL